MREPPLAKKAFADAHRITPACAGTTNGPVCRKRSDEDHPRVCGNHLACVMKRLIQGGSPPRVREPRNYPDQIVIRGRITPACAGTTTSLFGIIRPARDHPRVCGNHCRFSPYAPHILGSPPRVREPLRRAGQAAHEARITPACAGTTSAA